MISDTIRNVLYPSAVVFGVGCIWTMGWSASLAARADRTDPPLVSAEQLEQWRPATQPPKAAPAGGGSAAQRVCDVDDHD